MDPDELEAIILQRIMDTTTTFQRAVFMVLLSMQEFTFQYVNCSETQSVSLWTCNFINPTIWCFMDLQGQLTEGVDVVDYLMAQPNVVPRINPRILSTDRHYLDFTANPGEMLFEFQFCFLVIVQQSILSFI